MTVVNFQDKAFQRVALRVRQDEIDGKRFMSKTKFAHMLRDEFLHLCGTRGGTQEEFGEWLAKPAQRRRLRERADIEFARELWREYSQSPKD